VTTLLQIYCRIPRWTDFAVGICQSYCDTFFDSRWSICFCATHYLLLMHSILFIFKAVGLFRVSCYRLKHRIFASLRMCVVMLWSLYNVCIHFFGVMLYAPFSNNTVCIQCVHFIRVFHTFAWACICIDVCLVDEMSYNKFTAIRFAAFDSSWGRFCICNGLGARELYG